MPGGGGGIFQPPPDGGLVPGGGGGGPPEFQLLSKSPGGGGGADRGPIRGLGALGGANILGAELFRQCCLSSLLELLEGPENILFYFNDFDLAMHMHHH